MGQVASTPQTMQLSYNFPNFGSQRLLQRSKQSSDEQKLPNKEEIEIATDEAGLQSIGGDAGIQPHVVDGIITCTLEASINENVRSAIASTGAIDELVSLLLATPPSSIEESSNPLSLQDKSKNKSSSVEEHVSQLLPVCSKCSTKMDKSEFANFDHNLDEVVDGGFSRGSIGQVPSNFWVTFKDLVLQNFFIPMVSVFVVGTVVYCRGHPELATPFLRVAFKHFLGVFQNLMQIAKAAAHELWTVGGIFTPLSQLD